MMMNIGSNKPQMPDEAYESYGRKVDKCQYCNSYNVSLDSSSGNIICNNPECEHKNEKQKGGKEDFDKKIEKIHNAERKDLEHAIRRGDSVQLGGSMIPGINDEPKPKG